MDGFRDRERMGRETAERDSSERYDRYDRYSSRYGGRGGRGSYSAPEGLSAEEVTNIVEDSNTKQLDIINDFFEDAKADRLESEKQIISAIDDFSKDIIDKLESGQGVKEVTPQSDQQIVSAIDDLSRDMMDKIEGSHADILARIEGSQADIIAKLDESKAAAPVVEAPVSEPARDDLSGEILQTVNSNNNLLASFAEEQLPMLVRGNTSILNQITQTIDDNDEMLRQILDKTNSISSEIANISSSEPAPAQAPVYQESAPVNDNSEEILNAATNNNALLNALRSEVAALQQQLRDVGSGIEAGRPAADENAPLDNEDVLSKSAADTMYKALEEHVHSECVKVYRNFQKTLEDQNKAVIDEVGKSAGGVRIFALLAFILSLFNLIITFLRIYEIL